MPALLSDAARLAERSLRDHPARNTAAAIARGPYRVDQIGIPDIQAGLAELEAAGRAVERLGRWRLTG
jgi:hypothetical protein